MQFRRIHEKSNFFISRKYFFFSRKNLLFMEMQNFFNSFVKLSNKKRFVETLLFTFALPLVLALPAEEEGGGGGGREHRVALASSYSRLKTEATAL